MRKHHWNRRQLLRRCRWDMPTELLENRRMLSVVEIDPTWGDLGGTGSLTAGMLDFKSAGSKVLVLESAYAPTTGQSSLNIARLNAGGRLDTSFATNGTANVPVAFTWYDTGTASFTTQADGKILVLVGKGYGSDEFGLSITRLTSNGARDPSFGTNGVTEVSFPGTVSNGYGESSIAIAPDGKVIVSGTNGGVGVHLARFTAGGQLDTTFDTDGRVQAIGSITNACIKSLAIQGDGQIVVAGDGFAAAKFTTAGALDPSFGDGGITGAPEEEYTMRRGVFVDPTGAIMLLQSWTYGGPLPEGEFGLTRLTANGAMDTTFNGVSDPIARVASDPATGRLVVLTGIGYGSDTLQRLMPDGASDPDFNDGQPIGGVSTSNPTSLAVASDGDVLLFESLGGVTRYAPRAEVELGANGTLVVNGTDSADTIVIETAGSDVKVTRNGAVSAYPAADIELLYTRTLGGNDVVTSSINIATHIDAGPGNDSMTTGAGADTLLGGDGNDSINAGNGNDFVSGEEGADSLAGGAGNDTLSDAWGFNTIAGGDGNDVIGSSWGESEHGNVASVTGGDGNDTIFGTLGNDSLFGNAGADRLFGFGGNDLIVGNGGNDRLEGGTGADRLYGRAGIDRIDGGAGNDRVFGDDGDDFLLQGGPGNDQVYGGAGNDMICGGSGDDALFCGGGADTLIGNKGDDTLSAADSASDLLDGGKGADGAFADADTLDSLTSVEELLS